MPALVFWIASQAHAAAIVRFFIELESGHLKKSWAW
jgi:hypothetical protein